MSITILRKFFLFTIIILHALVLTSCNAGNISNKTTPNNIIPDNENKPGERALVLNVSSISNTHIVGSSLFVLVSGGESGQLVNLDVQSSTGSISLESSTCKLDSEGKCNVIAYVLSVGSSTIIASANGYKPGEITINPVIGTVKIEVPALYTGSESLVILTSLINNEPTPQVKISLSTTNSSLVSIPTQASCISNVEGKCSISVKGNKVGSATLFAYAEGYAAIPQLAKVYPLDIRVLTLSPNPVIVTENLREIAVAEAIFNGRNISDVPITLKAVDGTGSIKIAPESCITGSGNTCENISINGLKAGDAYIAINSPGYEEIKVKVIIQSKPDKPLQVNFAAISDLHIRNDYNDKDFPSNINPEVGCYHRTPRPPKSCGGLGKKSFRHIMAKLDKELLRSKPATSFIVALGDVIVHAAGAKKKYIFDNVFTTFNNNLSFPLFYSFGNNDSLAGNYQQFTNSKGDSPYKFSRNNAPKGKGGFLSSGKRCASVNLPPCIINENTEYGFYSAYVEDRLKLISLNSIIFTYKPKFSPSRKGDEIQLDWLTHELANSKKNNEQAILVMHIAPTGWTANYKARFKNIVKSNPEVVIGIIAGHIHTDKLGTYRSNGNIIPILGVPGLSVADGNSSSFRTISIYRPSGSRAWKIQNYITHSFQGNVASTSKIVKFYDFNERFCGGRKLFMDCLAFQIKTRNKKFRSEMKATRHAHPSYGPRSVGNVIDYGKQSFNMNQNFNELPEFDLDDDMPDYDGELDPDYDHDDGELEEETNANKVS